MFPRLSTRVKYIGGILLLIFICDYFGIFVLIYEDDFQTTFHYPLDDRNILKYAKQLERGEKPDKQPINLHNFSYIINCHEKCLSNDEHTHENLRLVYIVKSSLKNFAKRNAIRQSWGFERRFSDVEIRTIFMLGAPPIDEQNIQKSITIENDNYQDIVQANFIDAYFNNTIKTLMAFKWAINYCSNSKFYMFVDDDYFVSTKNLLRFLRNPINYPEYLQNADDEFQRILKKLEQTDLLSQNLTIEDHFDIKRIQNMKVDTIESKKHLNKIENYLKKLQTNDNNEHGKIAKRSLLDVELSPNVKLYAGYVFASRPHRHKTSKWYISLDEYRWNRWPAYVTAGAFVLSRESLRTMYYVSMYTKHFR